MIGLKSDLCGRHMARGRATTLVTAAVRLEQCACHGVRQPAALRTQRQRPHRLLSRGLRTQRQRPHRLLSRAVLLLPPRDQQKAVDEAETPRGAYAVWTRDALARTRVRCALRGAHAQPGHG